MNNAPRYATLRDYLRVLRVNRWLIVVAAVVFAGAALALAVRQKPVYSATAALSIRDPTQDAQLLGGSVAPIDLPEATAAKNAQGIMQPAIVKEVARRLPHATSAAITSGVSASVQAATDLVLIQVKSTDAAFAARLADAYAAADKMVLRQAARSRFTTDATALQHQTGSLKKLVQDPYTRALYADRITRLRGLASSSDPVSLAGPAVVPSTPISPRPVRDAILGLILGLTLGVLAAFVRDSLDRRLRGASEISDQLSWPVLGHIREEALGRPGLISSNGRGTVADVDFEAFRVMRQNIQFLDVDNPPRTLLISSALPEEGKSTVAASLACAYALAGKRCLLVECDLRRPSLAARFGIPAGPGLTDFLLGQATPEQVVQIIPVVDTASTNGAVGATPPAAESTPAIVCITAGQMISHPGELLGSQRFATFLEEVASVYDVVILDSSPVLSVADTLELLPGVDGALLCVRVSRTTRDQAQALKRTIEHLPHGPVGLVVTGLRPGGEADFGYYSYSYAYGSAAR